MITKLKEVELVFRRLLVDANLGASQVRAPPYVSTALPVQRILNLVKTLNVPTHNYNFRTIRENPLYAEILKLTRKALNFIALNQLKTEKNLLDELTDDENTQASGQPQARNTVVYRSEDSSDSDGTEEDSDSDEDY